MDKKLDRYNIAMTIFIFLAIFILGFMSLVGQLVILRELAQAFYGNELSFAIVLTVWLFWTSVGSGLVSKLGYKIKDKTRLYFGCIFLSSILLLATLAIIKILRPLLGLIPGELISLPAMLVSAFLVIAPFTIIQGLLFTVAPSLLRGEHLQTPPTSTRVNTVYLLEAIGAFTGGLAYYVFGAGRFDPFQNLCYLNAFVILCSFLYLAIVAKRRTFAKLFALIFIVYLGFSFSHLPYRKLTQIMYRPFPVVQTQDSIYGNITVIKSEKDSTSFYETGVRLFSTSDRLSREETVHFALLADPRPRDILLIGGGIGSSLSEVLKYNPETVSYVELDPLLIEMGKDLLPETFTQPLEEANLIYGDGRYFINQTERKFDAILIGLPEPYNLQINRFYTEEFFEEAKARLTSDGILSLLVQSSESYLNKEQARLIVSLRKTLKRVFKNVAVLPGETNVFLASPGLDLEKLNLEFFLKRLEERGIENEFVNSYYLPARLDEFAIQNFNERLSEVKEADINEDLKPISYYYDFLLWSEITSPYLKKALTWTLNLDWKIPFFIILLLFAVLYFTARKRKKMRAVMTSVSFLGLTEISLEFLILLGFQIFYGYVYSQMIIVISAYMLGLVAGSAIGRRTAEKISPDKKYPLLISLEGTMIAFIVILAGIFFIGEYYGAHAKMNVFFRTGFPLLTALAGGIGGMQFPIANSLYLTESGEDGKKTGTIYACDLLGSSLGALVISTLVVPLLGIYLSLALLGFVNILCLCFLITAKGSDLHI